MINFFHGNDSHEDESARIPLELPILAIRNTVIFPSTVFPLSIGREASLKLIDDTMTGDRILGCMYQKDPETENPGFDDLYPAGTVCRILKMIQIPGSGKTVLLQGVDRFEVTGIVAEQTYLKATI